MVRESQSLYLVEVVPLDANGEESTTARRRRHRIAAESALHAIRIVTERQGTLLRINETGENRATAILEAENQSVSRVFAFSV